MPKRTGRHPDKALTAVQVRSAPPGRHADGNGLYLNVMPSGSRSWVLRLMVQGRRQDIGLGAFPLVGLAEAREEALQMRRIARAGGDPLAERRAARRVIPTFEAAARATYEEHKGSWKNPKHAAQWITTLETYVFPAIGSRTVDKVGTPDVRDVLLPIWLDKPETARRVRQRIGTVMDWASANGFHVGENPVRAVPRGLPKQPKGGGHFDAMPYAEVPAFLEALSAGGTAPSRAALAFGILTAARTGEIIGARWSEIDMEAATWTVPAARMKAGKLHVVPLISTVLEILHQMREVHSGRGDHVFESKPGKPLSNMAMAMLLRRMKVSYTVHGFRSAFRDWAAEQTGFPREVAEAALAHVVADKVEAAYRRGDLFGKRRQLMEAWAGFLAPKAGKVVPLRREA